jgi:hypothetical protein
MLIVQTLSSESGKIIEKRLEMILAHEKFGVEIKKIVFPLEPTIIGTTDI